MTQHYARSSVKMLDAVLVTGAGSAHSPWGPHRTFQLIGKTTAGSGSLICDVEVSNNNVDWLAAGTMTLTLSSSFSSCGFAMEASWLWVRGNVTTISGTNAQATLWLGC